MTASDHLQELTATAVADKMRQRSIVLVDVREPQEFLAERIQGALLFPLSSFDPAALPSAEACQIVFHCGSGKRSATAVARSVAAGIGHTAHMAGGIMAWKQAGLPTIG